ncbi:MAG: XRE family transcriptional regulator [Desulfurellales bacterium]|nr:MAG: XRE family transcriptional regulator [Desulfurellales bacterium]
MQTLADIVTAVSEGIARRKARIAKRKLDAQKDNVTNGSLLRIFRTRMGITYDDFVGMDAHIRQWISRVENGRAIITPEIARRFVTTIEGLKKKTKTQ